MNLVLKELTNICFYTPKADFKEGKSFQERRKKQHFSATTHFVKDHIFLKLNIYAKGYNLAPEL